MNQVFISHVEEDAEEALRIALGLEEAGYSTWCYEVDSIPGPSYLVQTGKAVADAEVVIVVISPHSLGSRQVTKEVVRAHESGKDFIPILRDITHVEFQNRQPEWREAMGAAASISIPPEGVIDILPRIIGGLAALGIQPGQRALEKRLALIRKAIDRPPAPPGNLGKESITTGLSPAGTIKKSARPRRWIKPVSIISAIIVLFIVIGIILSNSDESPSVPLTVYTPPSESVPSTEQPVSSPVSATPTKTAPEPEPSTPPTQYEMSFADNVVEYNPGAGTTSSHEVFSNALGVKDNHSVSLGCRGTLTIEFIDNELIDINGPDLYVYDIGGGRESFTAEISKDGIDWIDLGNFTGQPAYIDIHEYIAHGDKFNYVRITDATGERSGDTAGPDIDAVQTGVALLGAKEVVDFTRGEDTGKEYDEPLNALGIPDRTCLSLGHGGIVTVNFVDNYITDREGSDLYIFEAGGNENFKVEISKNGTNWIDLGKYKADVSMIDIHEYVAPDDKFTYVRITDGRSNWIKLAFVYTCGADIDAIGAVETEEGTEPALTTVSVTETPPETEPEPEPAPPPTKYELSFADQVVEYNPGADTYKKYYQNALGIPDGDYVSLGIGGILTVEFIDNELSDVNGADLCVFDDGGNDEFKVEISKDRINWIDVGNYKGEPAEIDIHDRIASGEKFSYVRITDAHSASSSPTAGPDIDAVQTRLVRIAAGKVVDFIQGKQTSAPYNDPTKALDISDGKSVTLGAGGILTLEFVDNYLTDVDGPDLYVFEKKGDEVIKVEISKDGTDWIDLGKFKGKPAKIDIHDKIAPGERFSYIRITDKTELYIVHPWVIVGAEIDAVEAAEAE